jgi:hypothetical protein
VDLARELSVKPPRLAGSSRALWKGQSKGDAHGHAPLSRPVITFFPSRHRNKADRFINRLGVIGLVGFADPGDRFWVGLMAEIPACENFKNTKTSKTFQISFGPSEKLLGRAGLVL